MNATLTYHSRNTQVSWPPLLAQQLTHWQSLASNASAEVILEHCREEARAYKVEVRLEVPGHDLRASAKDLTLEGALLLVTRDLEHQIRAGGSEPQGRVESTRQPKKTPKRRTRSPA